MDKLNQDVRNRLHFWWFIIAVVCVVIAYCYTKSKATDNYKTILRIASENCNLEVVKFSVKNLLDINTQIPELTTLHYASGAGCLEVVKFLIEEEADINTAEYEKCTALHAAAYEGNLEVIRFLLQKGANPNINDTDGHKPRDVAILRSRHNKDKPYSEIIHLLYDAERQHESKQ